MFTSIWFQSFSSIWKSFLCLSILVTSLCNYILDILVMTSSLCGVGFSNKCLVVSNCLVSQYYWSICSKSDSCGLFGLFCCKWDFIVFSPFVGAHSFWLVKIKTQSCKLLYSCLQEKTKQVQTKRKQIGTCKRSQQQQQKQARRRYRTEKREKE